MLVGRLTRNEKVGLKTVCHSSFFSQIHSVKENTKLPFLAFFCCKKLQMLSFRKQFFFQNLICEKKNVFEIWCVVKLLIQKLKVFAKFNLNLTRTEFLDSISDSLSNFSIKNVSQIQFLWQTSFLRRRWRGNFDVSLVCFGFFEHEFRNRICFY